MHIGIYLALGLSLAVGPTGARAARRLAPPPAAAFLVAVAVCAAAAFLMALGLLATALTETFTVVHVPAFAILRGPEPVPITVSVGAIIALIVLVARCSLVLRADVVALRALRRAVENCGHQTAGDLLVVADPLPHACVVPAGLRRPGRLVVSSGLLRALDARQRQVLLAHERSHLRHGHAWFRMVMRVAAALNPGLGSVRDQLDQTLERWADEDAARVVASRELAARSVGLAALAGCGPAAITRSAWRGPRTAVRTHVAARVAALLSDEPQSVWRATAVVGAMLCVMAMSLVMATHDMTVILEHGARPHGFL